MSNKVNETSTVLLAKDHTGMMVDYSGMLLQARDNMKRNAGWHKNMLEQLQGHLWILGKRFYAGDITVVDEFLQLYCIADEDRKRIVSKRSEAPKLYYMQDSRDYVGNDILFHALNGNGYVTDLRKAQTFTKEVAMHMHAMRSTDIPWPKAYIDAKTRPAVDMQYVKLDEALEGTGIVIKKEVKKKVRNRCLECRSFVTAAWPYVACKKCGAQA